MFVKKLEPHHSTILEELDARLDENNVIHLRLCMESLVGQDVVVTDPTQKNPVVKVRIKLSVYPGQDVQDIASDIFG